MEMVRYIQQSTGGYSKTILFSLFYLLDRESGSSFDHTLAPVVVAAVRSAWCIQGGYIIMESVLYAQYIVATCPRHGQILRLQRH
jgi:hypothetical protein